MPEKITAKEAGRRFAKAFAKRYENVINRKDTFETLTEHSHPAIQQLGREIFNIKPEQEK